MSSKIEGMYLPQARADRLIAAARMVIALFTLLALRVDPGMAVTALRRFLPLTATIFTIYSLVLLIVAIRVPLSSRSRLVIHLADFLLYSILIDPTKAPVGFFVFWIFCGMLRFEIRGAVASAIAALATYLTFALISPTLPQTPSFMMLRFASVIVVSLLVVAFGAYERRVRKELARIASWPQSRAANREAVVTETLRSARDLMEAHTAAMYWEESEEPWVWFAAAHEDEVLLVRQGPDFASTLIAPEAGDATFLCDWKRASVMQDDGSGPRFIDRTLIPPESRERLGLGSYAVSSCIKGDLVEGRIIFGFTRDATIDEIPLSDIVSRLVATRLDAAASAERMRDTAVGQERIRVARDLHDGILQSLTGAALQLESVHRLIGSDDDTARARVRNVQQVIEGDQRELRSFITQLRPEAASPRSASLLARLETLAARFERQWNVGVQITMEPEAPDFSDSLASEIYNIVTEAAANAAKHAGGTHIDVHIDAEDGEVVITVQDDGKGFPFHGTYDLNMLDDLKRGPVTLKERVASLKGDLRLESLPTGTRLEVTLEI